MKILFQKSFFLVCIFSISLFFGCAISIDNKDLVPSSAHPEAVQLENIRGKLIESLVEERLNIAVIREEGGEHGCMPQEPFYRLEVKESSEEISENWDALGEIPIETVWNESDIAQGIWFIESTGKVGIMNICLE